MSAAEQLREIVDQLNSSPEPNVELINEIGCGPLENLIRAHGVTLWPDVERLARSDPRFRRALSSVWAYDSPEYERRTQLLTELGEAQTVRVSFITEPDDFTPVPRVSWRAVEIERDPPGRQLGRLLREIADWYERAPLDGNPAVIANRAVTRSYLAWAQHADSLERLWHEVGVAPDLPSLRTAVRRAGPLQDAERQAWSELVGAVEGDPTKSA